MKLANCKEHPVNDPSLSCWKVRHDDGRKATPEEIILAINEAAISEREACAMVVDEFKYWVGRQAKHEIAEAIRMRPNV